MRTTLRIAVTGLLLAVMAGCGVPIQDDPTVVPDAVLPSDAPAEAVPPDGGPLEAVELYLVESDLLRPVSRRVEAGELGTVLRALFEGPTEEEIDGGVRTAIPPDTRLRSAAARDGVATIDVGRSFLDATGREQILAVAQLVFTATTGADVRTVQLVVESEPVEVPLGDGTLTPAPVSRADYAGLEAPVPGS